MKNIPKLLQAPILIVDDNSNNLKFLSQALKNAGWTVAIAKNGEIALKQVKHTPPALILLDVMMPVMDGFETCKRLKEDSETIDIPVIFMTALSDTVDKVKGLSLGAVDYITKPFQTEEVLARVSIHYQLRALTKQLEEHNQRLEKQVAERTAQLVQQEKMASLGNLAAGVAHEINNPLTFISGNVDAAQGYIRDMFQILKLYQQEVDRPSENLLEAIEEADLEFLEEDLPKVIASMHSGVERIRDISTSMRIFSRSDTVAKVKFNLHEGIDSTLMILKYKLKAKEKRSAIEIIKKYGDVPPVFGFPGPLNQVFMNILANAIDALEEANMGSEERNKKKIMIMTEVKYGKAIARIRDNGVGMTDEVRRKMFESGFTTKAVGKGTGLGMAIARQIVEEKHGGTITCNSKLGKGTEFIIAIPIE
ncbi:MAG: response regulator [Hormoscilla sp.]